jgi:hypothetical protein
MLIAAARCSTPRRNSPRATLRPDWRKRTPRSRPRRSCSISTCTHALAKVCVSVLLPRIRVTDTDDSSTSILSQSLLRYSIHQNANARHPTSIPANGKIIQAPTNQPKNSAKLKLSAAIPANTATRSRRVLASLGLSSSRIVLIQPARSRVRSRPEKQRDVSKFQDLQRSAVGQKRVICYGRASLARTHREQARPAHMTQGVKTRNPPGWSR